MDSPRHRFVQGRHRRRGRSRRRWCARRRSSCTSPPRRTSTARFSRAGDFIHTDVFGTFVLLEAAREAPRLRRFVQISTDEVYGSVPEGTSRETDELRPRNPYSASKAGADRLGLQLLGDLSRAGRRHARVEQLRPEPVSREGHPAVHHQRHRQQAGAALRRRPERARLAARRRPLPRASTLLIDARRSPARSTTSAAATKCANVDLTHRILELAGTAGVADPAGRRSARPRSPLRARHDEAAGARLAAAAWRSKPGSRPPSTGTARTSGGGGRSRSRTRRSARTTTRSTAAPVVAPEAAMTSTTTLVTGATGFAGGHCSTACRRARRSSPGTGLAARRPTSNAAVSTGKAVDLARRATPSSRRPRRRCADADLPRRRRAAGGHVVAAARCRTSRRTRSARIICSRPCGLGGRAVPRARRVVGADLPDDATSRSTKRRRSCPARPYGLSKLAQDQLAQRACRDDGLDVVVARPFNHIGPGQNPAFAIAELRAPDRAHRSGPRAAGDPRRQSRRRRDITDVRDVVEAYAASWTAAAGPRRTTSAPAARGGSAICSTSSCSLARRRCASKMDAARLRPNDVPVVQGDATRIRVEIGWMPQIRVEQTLRDTLDCWRAEVSAGQ